ncbi:MAG TPA: hypothetical protein VFE47_18815 [Tepidisphaeraceae bacterium]|jgi:sialate O-acetylesterase|nr:hypothetical protein [Tepidisphaeraceae bacterium]
MKFSTRLISITLFASLGLLVPVAGANVKCASIFTDHMVLQHDVPLPVWGTAEAGEAVTVKVGQQSKSATADANGKWKVMLDALPVGGPVKVEVAGKNAIVFDDVLVGDVWICSGQSNMGFHLKQADNADAEIAAANFPNLRLFDVKHRTADKPVDSVGGKWEPCTPKTVPMFSAVGYFFGRDIHQKIGIPIGLIHTSWGGTPAEAWTDLPTLQSDPDFAPILGRLNNYPAQYPKDLARYEAAVEKQKSLPADAKKPALRKPFPPDANPYLATVLYNGMVAPLQPYAIKGVIWYQGEANTGRAAQYRKLLPAMIQDWRRTWAGGGSPSLLNASDAKAAQPGNAFPFLIVQLANYSANKPDGSSPWAELREGQWLTAAKTPNCGIAVTIDIGNPTNVHPTNKQEVGRRLGLVAEKMVYGRDVEDSGPTFASMAVDGNKVRVKFDHQAGGMEARGGKLEGFTIAGEDQKFYPAEAAIEAGDAAGGQVIVLSSPDVAHPVAVRYGWANSPSCTLYNKANLPAPPFRTDDWPMVTAKAR